MAGSKLIVFAFLVLATGMEVTGDAIVRIGLGQPAIPAKTLYFAGGAVLLFGYGVALNAAPIEFHKVVGVYIATLFAMWQIVSFITFDARPTPPILLGGGLIIVGGLIVAFWDTSDAA